jgi:hypothetical protein
MEWMQEKLLFCDCHKKDKKFLKIKTKVQFLTNRCYLGKRNLKPAIQSIQVMKNDNEEKRKKRSQERNHELELVQRK